MSQRTHIPQHVEKQISQYMEKSMPGHLKQYAGAYMQQRVIQPNTANPHTVMARNLGSKQFSVAPTPDKLKLSHNMPNGEQYNVNWAENPGQQPDPLAPASHSFQPAQPPQQAAPNTAQPQPYDFIMNPEQPKQHKASLPGGNSAAMRAVFIAGGLLVLLIVFTVIKGLLGGSSNLDSFVAVAQDQQELIHLATNADQQPDLSTTNKNFTATAELSLGSAQSQLIKYLSTNGTKVTAKQLALKISSQTDARLTTSAAATTYNQTFKEIVNDKLTTYVTDLQQTYNHTSGNKGKALLSDQYQQAQLLITQLNSSASTD